MKRHVVWIASLGLSVSCTGLIDSQEERPLFAVDQGSTTGQDMMREDMAGVVTPDMGEDEPDLRALDLGGLDLGEPRADMAEELPDMPAPEDIPGDMPAEEMDMPTPPEDMPAMLACDYREVDGVVAWQAEGMARVEDWETGDDAGTGYLFWSGAQFLGDPTHGVMQVKVRIDQAGRYQLQTRNRVGMGTSPTDHNDFWVRFPDAQDSYGLRNGLPEDRRYHKPICNDAAAMARIEAAADVNSATCVMGSSLDGWMKVYSSGALDWKWSTFTSDNDGSRVMVEFAQPGVYTLEMAARSSFLLIDQIVLNEESVPDATARTAEERACP